MTTRSLLSSPFGSPLVGLTALVALSLASGAGPVVAPRTPAHERTSSHADRHPRAAAVTAVALTVADLDRSVAWYENTLDAELVSTAELSGDAFERLTGLFGARARVADLAIGTEHIHLLEFLSPRGRPFPPDSRANDRWFQHAAIIVRDMGEAYAHLREHNVESASSEPQRLPDWNPNAAGIDAFYFRDPDGHFLEVLAFPPGKGDTRWQSNERLFLGIDHTAIVVDDTDAALRFYRDTLDMTIAGTSENFGTEQEHLNAVFPAHLRITSLRAPEGPAIELLEYLTPRTGRPSPIDSAPNDLWYWHVLIETEDPGAMFSLSRAAGGFPVSSEPQGVVFPGDTTPVHAALIARDPDGHALLFHATPHD